MNNEEDYIEKLIQVIESKPALYNKAMNEHSDRNRIKQLWNEVCEVMVEKWNKLSSAEKTTKGNEIQQRWRNLRTCFKRELNKQKGKSGQSANKRRKYIFFDQLLFLLPTMEDRMTVSDISSPQQEEVENECIVDSEDDSIQQQRSPTSTKTRKSKNKLTYEESLLAILKEKGTDEIDEDKTFLLSLVPSFKKFTDDQKIEAKMEFLSIIRRISQSNSVYKLTQPHSHIQQTQSFTNSNTYSYPQYFQQPAISVPPGPSSASTSVSTPEYSCSQSNPTSPLSQLYDLS